MSPEPPRSAAIVAVGDELMAGDITDGNSTFLARSLTEHGLRVRRIVVVGDDEATLAQTFAYLAEHVDLIIVTGGLGPTLDDITRQAVARAMGVELAFSDEAWAQVTAFYNERLARAIPEANKRQALLPIGASLLANERGTAPGLRAEWDATTLFSLPGPPIEMTAMFARHVAPWLEAGRAGRDVANVQRFYLYGLSESVFAERVGPRMERDANPLLGVTVKDSLMSLRLIAHGAAQPDVDRLLAERAGELRADFAEFIYSEEHANPAAALGAELIERGITVTAAESCTGGMIAAALTDVPGISAVLAASWVTYSNAAKHEQLGVPAELLDEHGAVSAPVVEAMAAGAAERAGARLAVAVSGIAGPDGGSPEKPVGLVWFGVSFDGRVTSEELRFPRMGRVRIRERAKNHALVLMLRTIRAV